MMARAVGPVFVGGCPRSGTSAMSWAIAAHPGYWTSVETHYFYYLLRDGFLPDVYARSCGRGSWLDEHGIPYQEFLQNLGSGLDRMMRDRSRGRQWVDGSPENILVAEQLLTMYPSAQVIFMIRSPLAVCLSMLNSGFSEDWGSDTDAAIGTWCHYANRGLKLIGEFPDQVTSIKQEDMLHDPGLVAARIGRRLRLDDPRAIAQFLEDERINSSFVPGSYVGGSVHQPGGSAPSIGVIEFLAQYGATIRMRAGGLAERYGYRWEYLEQST